VETEDILVEKDIKKVKVFERYKMSQLRIDANDMFTIDITVRESDPYTKAVFVKFERNYLPESRQGCDEMFLTTDQLESLGRFLCRQADEIRRARHPQHLTIYSVDTPKPSYK